MKIRTYPDSILRKKASPATEEEAAELYRALVAEMINYQGIGLAAPQVGIDKQIAVISDKSFENLKKPLLLLNPVIIKTRGEQAIEEACLSVKGVTCKVKRADKILVETGPFQNRKVIEASGLLSIVMQHEIDHLNGILFPDRASLPARFWLLLRARGKKKKGKDEKG